MLSWRKRNLGVFQNITWDDYIFIDNDYMKASTEV